MGRRSRLGDSVKSGWGLDRVALNVSDLGRSIRFYCEALGFVVAHEVGADSHLAAALGVRGVSTARLRRGGQMLELCACDPPGAPMPEGSRSNDGWFQHCALVSGDMAGDYRRLRRYEFEPISRDGPQRLPGGIMAFKFRDPDGHPLELISFPVVHSATAGGIDHSAICVADVERSVSFYAARVGLAVGARQVNQGVAQDALDDLDGVVVDVVALVPAVAGPHVELLGYRQPRGRQAMPAHAGDIAASRLVFTGGIPGKGIELLRDPDGHAVMLEHHGIGRG